jgi:pimeloyl-ACP methyl ester carboxylesterase
MRHALTTDGVAVAFTDLGGDGPPLLLAHATGFHGHVWRPVARRLADTFHLFTSDERGHGDTPPREDGVFEWQGFARDALAVIDELGLERPFGFGHSAGGAALLLAELDRPGTFRSLYCFEPIVPPIGEDGMPAIPMQGNPLAAGARRRRDEFASRDEAFDNYASKPPFSVLRSDALRAYVDHGFADTADGSVRLKCRPESEARTYEMGGQHGAFGRLAGVRCPVTIAYGETTTTFGPTAFAMQADRLPHGRLEELPRLGHFGPLEDPAAVAASVVATFAAASPE